MLVQSIDDLRDLSHKADEFKSSPRRDPRALDFNSVASQSHEKLQGFGALHGALHRAGHSALGHGTQGCASRASPRNGIDGGRDGGRDGGHSGDRGGRDSRDGRDDRRGSEEVGEGCAEEVSLLSAIQCEIDDLVVEILRPEHEVEFASHGTMTDSTSLVSHATMTEPEYEPDLASHATMTDVATLASHATMTDVATLASHATMTDVATLASHATMTEPDLASHATMTEPEYEPDLASCATMTDSAPTLQVARCLTWHAAVDVFTFCVDGKPSRICVFDKLRFTDTPDPVPTLQSRATATDSLVGVRDRAVLTDEVVIGGREVVAPFCVCLHMLRLHARCIVAHAAHFCSCGWRMPCR